jgi:hypothetical protein
MVTGREQWLDGETYAFHSKFISDIYWYLASFQSIIIFDYRFRFLSQRSCILKLRIVHLTCTTAQKVIERQRRLVTRTWKLISDRDHVRNIKAPQAGESRGSLLGAFNTYL